MTNIVVCYPALPKHLDWLQSAAPSANIINAGQEGIGDRIFDADIFVGHAKVPVDWDGVVKQGRLRFIQSFALALTEKLLVYATGHRIEFTDREAAKEKLAATKSSRHGLRSLIHAVIQSPTFRNK